MARASSVLALLCLLMLLPCTLVAGRLLSVDTVVGGIVVDMVGCVMVGCVVVEARHKQLIFRLESVLFIVDLRRLLFLQNAWRHNY